MRLSGVSLRGLTFFPKSEKVFQPCEHKYGAVATWSQSTDKMQTGYANGEINGFKYNMALTAFVNPLVPSEVVDVKDIHGTGRINFGVYFPTDRWYNPNTSQIETIPDYTATTWTQSGVNAGFITSDKIGTSKTVRYPNHGQEMYDLTNGLYGYDVQNQNDGQIDVTTPLIDYVVNWFYKTFGYYPSSASYRNGQDGVYYNLLPYFLGVRNSFYDYTVGYNFNHLESINKAITTRQGDMAGTREEIHQQCVGYLQNAINTGGWYTDFTHWHTAPDTELENFMSSQRTTIGNSDVVTLDMGTALEYKFLRDMVRRISLITNGSKLKIITEIKDFESLPLNRIRTNLSVNVNLTGTILEGKEIKGNCDIVKKGVDNFIIEIPYNQQDGFSIVEIEETIEPTYLNFNLPQFTNIILNTNILNVQTDLPTKIVIYSVPKGYGLYNANVMKRDSTFNTNHNVDVTGIDFADKDIYIGAISERNQSILSEKYNF